MGESLTLFCKAVDKMGLQDWERFSPHLLRHLYVNQLANDPRVSEKECILACRHTSISTSVNYQSQILGAIKTEFGLWDTIYCQRIQQYQHQNYLLKMINLFLKKTFLRHYQQKMKIH